MGKTSIIDIYYKYYSPTASEVANTPKMGFTEFILLASIDPTAFKKKPNLWGEKLLFYLNRRLLDDYYLTNYINHISKGKYLQWIIKNKAFIEEETKLDEIHDALFWYDYNKPYLEKPDIYAYTAQQLLDFWVQNSNIDLKLQHELQKAEDKGGQMVYFDDDWAIVVPKTFEASCYYGQFTKWCTTERDDTSYYYNYMKKGPLYISIDRHSHHKYQFYFVPGEFDFRNEVDDAVYPWDVDMPESAKDFFRKVSGTKGYTTNELNAFLANGKKPEEVFDFVGPEKYGYKLVKIDMRYNYLNVATNQLVGQQWYFYAQNFTKKGAKVWIQRFTHNYLLADLTYANEKHIVDYGEDAWKHKDYYKHNPAGKAQDSE